MIRRVKGNIHHLLTSKPKYLHYPAFDIFSPPGKARQLSTLMAFAGSYRRAPAALLALPKLAKKVQFKPWNVGESQS
jgi:hypothetical protein